MTEAINSISMSALEVESINTLALNCLAEGNKIDLSRVYYGFIHWGNPAEKVFCYDRPYYYTFLSGFIKLKKIRKILELGTHMGGSTIAMYQGFAQPYTGEEELITVDITDLSDKALAPFPLIKKIQAKAETEEAAYAVSKAKFGSTFDLIFIDTFHDYSSTRIQFDTFTEMLKPKFVILDDINLNDEMKKLWSELKIQYKENAIDLSGISLDIREPAVGFGLIIMQS